MRAVWLYGVVLVAGVQLVGCGSGDSTLQLTATVTETPPPAAIPTLTATLAPPSTPTRTPLPTFRSFSYRLTEGSSIIIGTGTSEPGARFAITGSLAVRLSEQLVPNSYFSYDVLNVEIQSDPPLTVTVGGPSSAGCFNGGGYGCFEAVTIFLPLQVDGSIVLSINGDVVSLYGQHDLPQDFDFQTLPSLIDLELCGPSDRVQASCADIRSGITPGYVLTVYAEPIV